MRAEARREGGEDALRKAQYMIRQLSQEKSELQKQVVELEAKVDGLNKAQEDKDAHLAKSQSNNARLVERVQSDMEKFKTLLERYRETVKTLHQSNADNQYLVKAVQEREQWMADCRNRNQGLFAANSDLLARYNKAATRFSEPLTGISSVSVETKPRTIDSNWKTCRSHHTSPRWRWRRTCKHPGRPATATIRVPASTEPVQSIGNGESDPTATHLPPQGQVGTWISADFCGCHGA